MDIKWKTKHHDRIEMKKLKLPADLEIRSKSEVITIKTDDENVWINISSSSAVNFSLTTLLKVKQFTSLIKNVKQNFIVMFANKKVVKIKIGI
ncbi:hypothetical protein [Marivirga sp.]|uniref:hypothetical protein n=1 Tax=Marivirga sp. TaxID=2018662 RepID=UPI002D7F37BC|nr:hypothetical protein [Marivirga sp.]HET8858907.1 hypothetical protein [Marivirga sp.]